MQRNRYRIYIIPILLAIVFGILLNGLPAGEAIAEEERADIRVHFIDVGQGDCSFIELPDGKTMLIDAGQKEYGKTVVKYIKKLGYKKIDYIVATHSDSDHVGGLAKVIDSFEVEVIYRPFTVSNNVTIKNFKDELVDKFKDEPEILDIESGLDYAKFLKAAYDETCGGNLCEIRICSDKEVIISEDPKAPYIIKFFAPQAISSFSTTRIKSGYTIFKADERNETSAVVEVISKSHKYLFTGDMTESAEWALMENMTAVDADLLVDISVLKVSHHGSAGASTEEFLQLIKPASAVIMVGENNEYGLPNTETISRLESVGAAIYRTDELGTIIVEERNGSIFFANIKTETFFEKYDWILYSVIGVVMVGLILIIAFYPKLKNKFFNKGNKGKNLSISVDKK